MDKTQNYSLQKPLSIEKYSVSVHNMNMDLIDSALQRIEQKNESQDNLLASKKSLNEHIDNKNNPHEVTKIQIGLSNADNTSDIDKPVSLAQQNAIDEALYQSNQYTNVKIAELVNGAPETLDTLKEISDVLSENETIMEALDAAISTKSNQTELDTHTGNDVIHVTQLNKDAWNFAKEHADSGHARTDATKVEKSDINGYLKIDGVERSVYTHPEGTNPHGMTKTDLGLENVENKSSEIIRSEITKENVISALGYTPPTTNTTYSASNTIPKANGTANVGTESEYARGDHVHPSQTTIPGNAGTATKWENARNINGLSIQGDTNMVNYGICSTVAATVEKIVDCPGFALIIGSEITIKFTVTNTAANPTLNVNNTGAKAIYYRGSAISAGYLATNRTYTFRYNGTQYELVGDVNTNTTYKVVSTSANGLCPKRDGSTSKFLRGDGTWAAPSGSNEITYSDSEPTTLIKDMTWIGN